MLEKINLSKKHAKSQPSCNKGRNELVKELTIKSGDRLDARFHLVKNDQEIKNY